VILLGSMNQFDLRSRFTLSGASNRHRVHPTERSTHEH
jgi:hypothetical protein